MTAAERLSIRLDELASAVHNAGGPADASARLIELAAAATLRAMALELRLAERNLPRGREATSAAAPALPHESSLTAAA